jgi:phage tail protein X
LAPAPDASTAALGLDEQAASIQRPLPESRVNEARPVEASAPAVGGEIERPPPHDVGLPSAPPSSDVLTVPTTSRSSEPPLAVVTIQTGDTLPMLVRSVYGRVDDTLVDAVQLANTGVDRGRLPSPGQRLRFPPAEPAAMVHKLGDRRYVVHLFTTSDPMDQRIRKLSVDVGATGRMVRVIPVSLWTGCDNCYRVWIGEFTSQHEAEAVYRRVHPGNAA